jgi:large subunit ribosomal protein L21
MVGDTESTRIGTPLLGGAYVVLELIGEGKGDKIIVFKSRQRQKTKKEQGHRQALAVWKVLEVGATGVDQLASRYPGIVSMRDAHLASAEEADV